MGAGTRPVITVLTAVRDGAAFLPEAIESVRCQTFEDWEYVVVDDASEDESARIAERIAETDLRIVVVRRATSGGPYVAANEGLEAARGEYVARLDADDVAVPHRLEHQLGVLRAEEGVRAVGAFARELFPDGTSDERLAAVPTSPGVLKWWLTAGGGPTHSTLMIERAALEAVGGYRPLRLAADRWLWCDLARRGWLAVVPEVLVHRRRHSAQLGVTVSGEQRDLALQGAQHHLEELTGRTWSWEEVGVLHRIAHRHPVSRVTGVRVLARWTWHWMRDRHLVTGERRRLAYLTRKWIRRVLTRADA